MFTSYDGQRGGGGGGGGGGGKKKCFKGALFIHSGTLNGERGGRREEKEEILDGKKTVYFSPLLACSLLKTEVTNLFVNATHLYGV